jgi:hypothetical protein
MQQRLQNNLPIFRLRVILYASQVLIALLLLLLLLKQYQQRLHR